MLPLRNILCPIDFSEPSQKALEVGKELAGHFSAHVHLLHVVPPIHVIPGFDAPDTITPSLLEDMEASANSKLMKLVEEGFPEGVETSAQVIRGDPAGEIVRAAGDLNTDVIVIATHGLTGWRRLMFGSVAAKVIRMSPCPVISIRFEPDAEESES